MVTQPPLPLNTPSWDDRNVPTGTYKEYASFTFHGEAVEGTMRAEDFGQALLGYSRMVGETARTISPKASNTDVRVTATKQGSFLTELAISVDLTATEAVLDWFKGENSEAVARALGVAADSKEIIGLVILGAVGIIKRRRGRAIVKRQKVDNKHDKVTLEDGEDFLALAHAVAVSEKPAFRRGLADFSEPLTRPGIDSVTLNTSQGGENITPADRAWFTEEGERDTIEVSSMRLQVLRPAFDDAPWRLRNIAPEDGSLPYDFSAQIADEGFLDDVAQRRFSFADGDQIDATVEVAYPGAPRRRRRYKVLTVQDVYTNEQGFLTADGLDLQEDFTN